MIVLSGVQFNAISVMNSSSLMTRGERSILNFGKLFKSPL